MAAEEPKKADESASAETSTAKNDRRKNDRTEDTTAAKDKSSGQGQKNRPSGQNDQQKRPSGRGGQHRAASGAGGEKQMPRSGSQANSLSRSSSSGASGAAGGSDQAQSAAGSSGRSRGSKTLGAGTGAATGSGGTGPAGSPPSQSGPRAGSGSGASSKTSSPGASGTESADKAGKAGKSGKAGTADTATKSATSAGKTADGAKTTGQAADGGKNLGKASQGMDGAAGNLAGGAARKAVEGKGDSTGRRTAGRYAGSAVSGGVAGAQTGSAAGGVGALPGAAAGAVKGVAAEGGKDAVKGVGKATGGGPSAKPADKRGLGAGGTSYERSTKNKNKSSTGKKVATGMAVAGGAAAAPPAALMLTLMALFKWLKTLFFQMAALAANLWAMALNWLVGMGKAALGVITAPFVALGGWISAGVTAVVGITLAPAVAVGSGVMASLAAFSLLGGLFVAGVGQVWGGGDAHISDSRCVSPAGGGYDGGPIEPTEIAHAQAVYGTLKNKGMPDENIAGILGNWSQESGVDPTSVQGIFDEPYEVGPKKQRKLSSATNFGIGLGQWTADRNQMLRDYADAKGEDWHNLQLQLDFMADPAGDNPSDVAIFEDMIENSLGSPREAAIHFEEEWERAGVPAMENRIAAAERWYDEMQTWDGVSAASGGDVQNVSDQDTGQDNLNLGPVKPHVQAAAEHLYAEFSDGVTTVGGYREESGRDPGDHPKGLAIDLMVELSDEGKQTGDALAQYVVENAEELNVKYVIWYQQIWHVDRADEGWRDMEDRGSPTQNHKDHPHVSFQPSGSMGDVSPPPGEECEPADGGGNTGIVDGGMDMAQAEAFMEEYNQTGDAFLRDKYNGGGPGQCNGDYVQNCVSFSVYFLNKYTSFTDYPQGNGKDTASRTASMTGKELSDTPSVYSVFSHPNTSAAGHTGIVLGIDGDRLLIGEAGYCAFAGRARWVEPSEWQNAGWSFVDVSDLLTAGGELEA